MLMAAGSGGGGRGGSVALSTVRPEKKSAGHFICTFQKTELSVVLVVEVEVMLGRCFGCGGLEVVVVL